MKKTKKQKNKTLFEDEIKVLKKYGLWWKENPLKKGTTVFIISIVATIVDGLTVYFTLNPILKGNLVMNLLLTITASAVLDAFPSYWVIGFDKAKNQNQSIIKILLAISIISWLLVFITLCLVRIKGWQFILESSLQEQYLNQQSNVDMFIPELDKSLGLIIMIFLNAVNFGTSAAVLLSAQISYTSEKTLKARKRFSISTLLNQIKFDRQSVISEINNLENVDFQAIEETKHNSYKFRAFEEAQKQKRISVEDLAKELGDPDVSEKLLNTNKN